MTPVRAAVGLAVAAALVTALLAPARAGEAAEQAWQPFVLVAGLLLIGLLAADDGLFAAAGARLARLPGGGVTLLVALLLLVAVVTAVLNLDTSVVFLTPVLVHSARRRGLAEAGFLYGAVFMSNSASLLLTGSNLTNLIVLAREHVAGGLFAARMAPAWAAAVAVTIVVVALCFHRSLREGSRSADELIRPRAGAGLLGTIAAALLVLALPRPGLPVLGLALALVGWRLVRRRIALAPVREALGAPVLTALFCAVVTLGAVARSWNGLGAFVHSLDRWPTAGVGALAAVLFDNLPASALLAASPPAHPRALLLGLNLGPNLAVTGSLSAVLWFRVARGLGCRPSAVTYSRIGLILVPLTLVAALAALSLFAPRGF